MRKMLDHWSQLVRLLVRSGIIVIPIESPFKKAKVGWKQWQRVFPQSWMYKRWLRDTASWAAITGIGSKIVVVDTDNPAAEEWAQKNLPYTPITTKTRKGFHRYFRYPNGQRITTKIAIKINGVETKIDIKANGGYVLLPGSLHPADHLVDKAVYASWSEQKKRQWAHSKQLRYEFGSKWNEDAIKNLPIFDINWFPVDRPPATRTTVFTPMKGKWHITEYARRLHKAKKYVSKMDPAIQGSGGDKKTYAAACRLVRDFELNEQDAFEVLRDYFNPSCVPPWTDDDLRRKVSLAMKSAKGQGGTYGQ